MLIEFTVGNFKSFRDKTTLSMIAANLISDDPALDQDNVVLVKKDLRLLKSAAVYGANASGKSNLGLAVRFMRQLVLNSAREAVTLIELGLEPFLLDRETRQQPSFFEVVFLVDDIQYRYGFEVDRSHVVSEWLLHVPKTKEVPLFLRVGQEIEVKPGFKEGKGLEIRTRSEALFLSVASLFNSDLAQNVQHWFTDFSVETGLEDDNFRDFTLHCLRDPEQKNKVLTLIHGMDLGVDDVFVPPEPPAEALPKEWSDELKNRFIAESTYRILVTHILKEPVETTDDLQLFDLDRQESQGTQKLVALAGPLYSMLEHGTILFIDELDARLHPLMTRRIIELFHSSLTNPKGAQLIFATHDTNLLDKSLFRRDQIWFAEKDQQGATHLASLAEYRVRNDAAFEKNYLEGRYGAIPFLGDLTQLPWAQGQGPLEEGIEREPARA